MFVVLHDNEWDKNLIKRLNKYVERRIRDKSMSNAFLLHFTEIVLGELTKVSAKILEQNI